MSYNPALQAQTARIQGTAASYPKAWVKVQAALGQDVAAFFSSYAIARSGNVSSTAIQLLQGLLDAAPTGGDESTQHAAWRVAIADLDRLVTRFDGGGDAKPSALTERIKKARLRTDLQPGAASILATLSVPSEPPNDAAFREALAAVQLYFL